jgi:hypothetical protein
VPVDSSWSDADMKKGLAETLESYTHSQSVTLSCLEHIGQVSDNYYVEDITEVYRSKFNKGSQD